jgi:hypothetical protein
MASVRTSSAASFLAAAIILVDGRPRPALRLLIGNTASLVAFRDVIGLSFLFVGIFRFVSAWHVSISCSGMVKRQSGMRVPVSDGTALPAATFAHEVEL